MWDSISWALKWSLKRGYNRQCKLPGMVDVPSFDSMRGMIGMDLHSLKFKAVCHANRTATGPQTAALQHQKM
jgi:hypothetical protein